MKALLHRIVSAPLATCLLILILSLPLQAAAGGILVIDSDGLAYTCSREDYASDAVFANFRMLRGGRLKEGLLYRSASPVDNICRRAQYADALMKKAGIAYVLDLADCEAEYAEYMAEPYYAGSFDAALYESGRVLLLDMTTLYAEPESRQKAAAGMLALLENEGPYLIHCTEGKERTGFFAMLLEALCGASYQELLADYLASFENYYGPDPEVYQDIAARRFDSMLACMTGREDAASFAADYSASAAEYLISGGMTRTQVDALIRLLTE